MRKLIIIGSLAGSLAIFCLTINLFDSFFMFVLFGILPGNKTPLAANQMLMGYGAVMLLLISFLLEKSIASVASRFWPVGLKKRVSL